MPNFGELIQAGIFRAQDAPRRAEQERAARIANDEAAFDLEQKREAQRNADEFNKRLGEISAMAKKPEATAFWDAVGKSTDDKGLQPVTPPVDLESLARDQEARPLFKNPRALQAIADAAIQYKQKDALPWLQKRATAEKEGIVDAALALRRNDTEGAARVFNETGDMRVKNIQKSKDDGVWDVTLGDGRTIQFNHEEELAAAFSPQTAIEMMKEKATEKRALQRPTIVPAGSSVLFQGKMIPVERSPEWESKTIKDADGNERLVFYNKYGKSQPDDAGAGGPGLEPSSAFNRRDHATLSDIDKDVRERLGTERIGEMGGAKWTHNDKSQAVSSIAQSIWQGSAEGGGRATLDKSKAVEIAIALDTGKAKRINFLRRDPKTREESLLPGIEYDGKQYLLGGQAGAGRPVPAAPASRGPTDESAIKGVPRAAFPEVIRATPLNPGENITDPTYQQRARQKYGELMLPDVPYQDAPLPGEVGLAQVGIRPAAPPQGTPARAQPAPINSPTAGAIQPSAGLMGPPAPRKIPPPPARRIQMGDGSIVPNPEYEAWAKQYSLEEYQAQTAEEGRGKAEEARRRMSQSGRIPVTSGVGLRL